MLNNTQEHSRKYPIFFSLWLAINRSYVLNGKTTIILSEAAVQKFSA